MSPAAAGRRCCQANTGAAALDMRNMPGKQAGIPSAIRNTEARHQAPSQKMSVAKTAPSAGESQ